MVTIILSVSYCSFDCVPSGLVDTAVKTAETGYMQRRLVKVHCSLYNYDEYTYSHYIWELLT